MSRFHPRRLAALAVSAVALAIPASALAHPSVYTSNARAVPSPAPSPINEGDLTTQTRYVVTNHGNSYVLRETNGQLNKGVLDYKLVPGAYRDQAAITTAVLVAQAATGAQPHATCKTPALEALDNITQWQEHTNSTTAQPPGKPEPFYDYIPFQKTSAHLGDLPEEWIPLVKTLTNFDLETVSDDPATAQAQLQAACQALPGPGVFVPADAVQTTAESFNSATILNATDPLNAQIAAFQAAAGADAQAKSAAATENASLKAEIARLKSAVLKIDPTGTLTTAQLAGAGVSATVTGPAGRTVKVRILAAKAKALKLKSRVLASANVKLGADGTATVKLLAGGKAKSALKKAKKSVAAVFQVVSGYRSDALEATLKR
jgi:hypothetical protein